MSSGDSPRLPTTLFAATRAGAAQARGAGPIIFSAMRAPGGIHRSSTRVMSFAMMVIGVLLIVRTVTLGGGPIAAGVLLGSLFFLAGAARLYIQSRSR